MKILIIAEHDHRSLRAATRSAVTAAAKLLKANSGAADLTKTDAIELLIAGQDVSAIAEQAKRLIGVSRVLTADDAIYLKPLAEDLASLVLSVAADYDAIIAAATSFGKNLLPRIAALMDVDMVSEVTDIVDASTFVRPIYAGHLNAKVRNDSAVKIFTIRPTAFESAQEGEPEARIDVVTAPETTHLSRWISSEIQQNERPELSTARVVVSGGRSLGSAERFNQLLNPIASKLNAAVGATRAAVDAGIAPNEYQVGQTGTVVAPELYIAIGVSGATQHIAGIKDSRIIVAINHDPDAQIFQWADYGLVADLFESLTELEKALD